MVYQPSVFVITGRRILNLGTLYAPNEQPKLFMLYFVILIDIRSKMMSSEWLFSFSTKADQSQWLSRSALVCKSQHPYRVDLLHLFIFQAHTKLTTRHRLFSGQLLIVYQYRIAYPADGCMAIYNSTTPIYHWLSSISAIVKKGPDYVSNAQK